MSSIKEYFSSVGKGVKSLVTGMGVTGKEFVTPKITECYPENRATLQIPERFRAELTLKYDNEGRHKCIACGICQMNCPNGTISLTKKMVELPDGKKKAKLDKYLYDWLFDFSQFHNILYEIPEYRPCCRFEIPAESHRRQMESCQKKLRWPVPVSESAYILLRQ